MIPRREFVSLKVYDILGNEIAVLINDEKQAGIYDAKFNAAAIPDSVYFYKLNAGFFVETKKMVLIK